MRLMEIELSWLRFRAFDSCFRIADYSGTKLSNTRAELVMWLSSVNNRRTSYIRTTYTQRTFAMLFTASLAVSATGFWWGPGRLMLYDTGNDIPSGDTL